MLKKRWTLFVFVLAVASLAAGGGLAQTRPELTEEFHQSYPLTAGGRVSLSNLNGKVRVTAWDRNEVRVDAVKRAYKPERLREAEIKINAGADHIDIETEYPKREREYRSGDKWEREDNPATVEYTLSVPRGARLDEVNLVNGALEIEGMSGSVNGSSVNGRVTARGLTGAVELSVVNGRLEASFDRLNEASSISLSSVNGPLALIIPSDSNALLKADTVHGSISNDFNLPVREGEYVGRDLEGRIGAGAARIKLSNVNGAITIRRAGDNRPLSPSTNLLSETPRHDADADEERESARDAAKDARDAVREAAREVREARREAERERVNETREEKRVREASQRDIEREVERTTRDAERIARDAERIVQRELAREKVGSNRSDAQRRIERESNSIAVQGASRVRVETFDGPVTIHAWDKPEVMYTAIKRAGDDREMKGIKVQAAAAGSEVVVRAEFDKSFAQDYVERGGRVVSFNSGASVEFDVYVPRSSTLFVSSGDGRLRVEGVSGELELRTGDGAIDVAESRGRLVAQTGDGRIRLDNFDGEASARTGDGRITLDGRFSELAARTGDGTSSLSIAEGTRRSKPTPSRSRTTAWRWP